MKSMGLYSRCEHDCTYYCIADFTDYLCFFVLFAMNFSTFHINEVQGEVLQREEGNLKLKKGKARKKEEYSVNSRRNAEGES